jgi:hypothetical protein
MSAFKHLAGVSQRGMSLVPFLNVYTLIINNTNCFICMHKKTEQSMYENVN